MFEITLDATRQLSPGPESLPCETTSGPCGESTVDENYMKLWYANLGSDMEEHRRDHHHAVGRARDASHFDNRLINSVTTQEVLTGDNYMEQILKANAGVHAPYPVAARA